MHVKTQNLWYRLQASFWFLPAMMAVAAMLLAFATAAIDKASLYQASAVQGWVYSGGPDDARTVLSTIAGSMITVAGVVFSITIVVLSLASSRFGPRLIRNFMNIRANQVVIRSPQLPVSIGWEPFSANWPGAGCPPPTATTRATVCGLSASPSRLKVWWMLRLP
jgi:hypothetical protein